MQMPDGVRSWLRTVVPAVWSSLVAWLVSIGAPDVVASALNDAFEPVVFPLVLAGVYALIRAVEPHMPVWLTRVLAGSSVPPAYKP